MDAQSTKPRIIPIRCLSERTVIGALHLAPGRHSLNSLTIARSFMPADSVYRLPQAPPDGCYWHCPRCLGHLSADGVETITKNDEPPKGHPGRTLTREQATREAVADAPAGAIFVASNTAAEGRPLLVGAAVVNVP